MAKGEGGVHATEGSFCSGIQEMAVLAPSRDVWPFTPLAHASGKSFRWQPDVALEHGVPAPRVVCTVKKISISARSVADFAGAGGDLN